MTSEVGKDHPVTFTQSDTTQVFAIAATWHTEAQPSTASHRTVDPNRIACFAGTYREGARIGADQSTTVGKVTVSEVSFPTIGDESKVYRIALPLESSGATFTIYVDYIVFRVQRGIGVLATFNLGRPFDPRFAAHLAAKRADRGAQTAPAVV